MDALVTSAIRAGRRFPEGDAETAPSEPVFRIGRYMFKALETPEEMEQVHCLNYRTFTEEIGQYSADGTGRRVDKFHAKNRYYIAVCDGRVVGMVSAHDQPPFSTAARLPDPRVLDQPGMSPLEVRLLAVDPSQRHSIVFAGLIWSLYQHARRGGYTHLLISGIAERRRLYERLGFEALGAAVSSGEAAFVPMILELGSLPPEIHRDVERWQRRLARREPAVSLLPGPVQAATAVCEAYGRPPVSHRSAAFVTLFGEVRDMLARLTGAPSVALFNGSGTLANDVVAAVLAAGETADRSGLILVNGEFGRRIVGQAGRFGLEFRTLEWPWGEPWGADQLRDALADRPGWVWGVHLETSTGVLNDLGSLTEWAGQCDVPVCVDCMSSLGAVPLDLRDIYLATATSGKSLGAYAGLAMVFASPQALAGADASRLPCYLDLPEAVAATGPRFTFPSAPLQALECALERYADAERATLRYNHHRAMGCFIRDQLRSLGVEPLASDDCAAPVCTTFCPPCGVSVEEFVGLCREWGFELAGHSAYLARRGWVQIATMGDVGQDDCRALFDQWRRWQEGVA